VRIFQVGHVEGWMSSVKDKENYAEGEQVDDLALIRLLGVDLRCHKAKRADNGAVHAVT